MPDYKKLYHKTFNALTDAESLLQQASAIIQKTQQECEELYLEAPDTPISLHKIPDNKTAEA